MNEQIKGEYLDRIYFFETLYEASQRIQKLIGIHGHNAFFQTKYGDNVIYSDVSGKEDKTEEQIVSEILKEVGSIKIEHLTFSDSHTHDLDEFKATIESTGAKGCGWSVNDAILNAYVCPYNKESSYQEN